LSQQARCSRRHHIRRGRRYSICATAARIPDACSL
jgi:hypothetical protein